MSNSLLRVYPSELKIPFEVRKQRSCHMQLTNRTDKYVAFKVKTTSPRKYTVRHTCGVLLPRSSCNVTVTMQASTDKLSDHHCKDKFLVQSVVVPDGATVKRFAPELFAKTPDRTIEEFKLRVVYIAANLPSPIPEEAEAETEADAEDSPPPSENMGYEMNSLSVFDASPTYVAASGAKAQPSCAEGTSVTSKLVGEMECLAHGEHKLWEEMELLTEIRSSQQGFSFIFVLLVFMSSVFIGRLMNDIKV